MGLERVRKWGLLGAIRAGPDLVGVLATVLVVATAVAAIVGVVYLGRG